MSKKSKSGGNVNIGQDATNNVIISGDHNVVTLDHGQGTVAGDSDGGVPKVFISSTTEDLREHREAARDAAITAGYLPVQMEYFVASGQHAPMAGCLQKVAEADVLVVIVAHRYGWVPGDQDGGENKSITWLECERALADGKEVLAFAVDKDADWHEKLKEEHRIAAAVLEGKATPELLAEVQRNVARLNDFKAWIDGLGFRATFSTPEELGWKVAEALANWKQNHPKFRQQPKDKKSKAAPQRTFPPAYRQWLGRQCADIDSLVGRRKEGQTVKLKHVYVPLITSVAGEEGSHARQSAEDVRRLATAATGEREKPQLLLEQLDKHSLYVAGDPGSGKSTFCRWVAWLVAAGSMPTAEVAVPEHYVESFPQSLAPRLPLLVRLRDVWNYLPQDAGRDTLSQTELESALANWLDTNSPGGLDWAAVTPHLEHGSALLIFDGLDEVPLRVGEGRRACYPRAMLLAGLVDAAPNWQQQGNRLLVTSRPYGMDEQQTRQLPLQQAPIRELDGKLQELLIRRWFRILKEHADEATQTASDMVRHLSERPELGPLTANPMLLTSMCIIYDEGKRLPQDKHDLYERIVDNVLHNRYRNDMTELDMARAHLSVVAYGMHTGDGLGQQRVTPQAEVPYQDIERMIQTYHAESAVTFTGYKNALETRDELLQRSGLLLSRGEKHAGFYHYTFQDFLAARRLADIQRDRLFEIFVDRAATAEWRNTLSFLFSSELANSPEQATRLLNRLVEQLTPDTVGLVVVAADCIETMLGRENRLREDVETKFKGICLAAIENEVEVKARATLGIALGRLGDPRVIHDLSDPSAFVEIPAGEYAYQDGKQTIDKPFLLSTYPVTNSQFAVFVSAGGYKQRKHWSNEGWQWKEREGVTEPLYWHDAKYNAPNQPVVGVSFYEAEAFCKWAGGFLPSEEQWEAAARGPEGVAYPWGSEWEDGICNSAEAKLGATSPVGLFPRSRSRDFGLEDMAGNVLEWCDSWYDEDKDSRVLRGGSFSDGAHFARAAFPDGVRPAVRWDFVGFRLART